LLIKVMTLIKLINYCAAMPPLRESIRTSTPDGCFAGESSGRRLGGGQRRMTQPIHEQEHENPATRCFGRRPMPSRAEPRHGL
jgi:hypothetical protein